MEEMDKVSVLFTIYYFDSHHIPIPSTLYQVHPSPYARRGVFSINKG